MSKEKITIYVKPTCTTCRKVLKILRESEADFDSVNYFEEPLSKKTLTQLVKSLGITPRDLLRKNEKIYKELGLSKKELSDSQIIELMVKHPDLLQRPIVIKGKEVVLARPAEEIEKLL
ncbi:MAG: arsenate reductase (glutaredoxin) [Thermodesulfobacteriota bacterium]|jgi:arsenate reductase|nr:arsenate reductase (glutaredoxin) [Candidatus Dadabacteria bacterium]MCZ6684859.1 arsenate reductase (glutaredoxin) [Candidatus Dadabacteria bacterium]